LKINQPTEKNLKLLFVTLLQAGLIHFLKEKFLLIWK